MIDFFCLVLLVFVVGLSGLLILTNPKAKHPDKDEADYWNDIFRKDGMG